MRNIRNFVLFVLILILVSFAFKTVEAQDGGEEHFPHNVVLKGEFLKYYLSVPEHQELFGNAISNEFVDMAGKRVQYFDRARFELVETDHGPEVHLATLGAYLYDESKIQSAGELVPSATCRYFSQTSHRVCYDFLQFYDEYQGTVYFGNPVSEMIIENGHYVQYFEYAKFEYHYNQPAGKKVGLTDIGQMEMVKLYGRGPKPTINSVISANQPEVPVLDMIQARAFVSQALVAPGSTNTLYVVVQLRSLKAVANAEVNVSIRNGDRTVSLPAQVTDADGIARIDIPAFDLAPKETVQMDVVVNSGEQTVKTSAWYRIWY